MVRKINWRDITELIAVTSVILSLVFVGFELRQNSRIASAAEYREIMNRLDAQRSLLAEDPTLAEIYRHYQRQTTNELTEIEYQQLTFIVANILSTYEIAYFSRQYRVVGDSEWERFSSGACTQYVRANSMGYIPLFLSSDFRSYLDGSC